MTLFAEDPIKEMLDGVDWLPLQGPICPREGLRATHLGFCRLGERELLVYKLEGGERVFDASNFEDAFGDDDS